MTFQLLVQVWTIQANLMIYGINMNGLGQRRQHSYSSILKATDLVTRRLATFRPLGGRSQPFLSVKRPIDYFTVVDLVPQPSGECEADGDLVLIQTSFALLWKLSLKNTSQHKNNLIYIIKQEGLYQNKGTVSLAFIHNCKIAYSPRSGRPRAMKSRAVDLRPAPYKIRQRTFLKVSVTRRKPCAVGVT